MRWRRSWLMILRTVSKFQDLELGGNVLLSSVSRLDTRGGRNGPIKKWYTYGQDICLSCLLHVLLRKIEKILFCWLCIPLHFISQEIYPLKLVCFVSSHLLCSQPGLSPKHVNQTQCITINVHSTTTDHHPAPLHDLVSLPKSDERHQSVDGTEDDGCDCVGRHD